MENVIYNNDRLNVAIYLAQKAKERPYKKPVVCHSGKDTNGNTAYTHLTFRQLHRESD